MSGRHAFAASQLAQLRAQIMAYRLLARNQPLSPELTVAIQGKKSDASAPAPNPPPMDGQGMRGHKGKLYFYIVRVLNVYFPYQKIANRLLRMQQIHLLCKYNHNHQRLHRLDRSQFPRKPVVLARCLNHVGLIHFWFFKNEKTGIYIKSSYFSSWRIIATCFFFFLESPHESLTVSTNCRIYPQTCRKTWESKQKLSCDVCEN